MLNVPLSYLTKRTFPDIEYSKIYCQRNIDLFKNCKTFENGTEQWSLRYEDMKYKYEGVA